MRRTALVAVMLLLTSAVVAQTPKISVGAFGGISLPIVQKDQSSGTEFGLRGRISLTSFFAAEAQLAFTKWGKPDPVNGLDLGIDGSKVTEIGVNGILGGGPGVGVKPFLVAGLGKYKIKNDATQYDVSRMGFSGGFGLGIGLAAKFGIEARGEAVVVPLDGGGSKKAVKGTAGVFVNF